MLRIRSSADWLLSLLYLRLMHLVLLIRPQSYRERTYNRGADQRVPASVGIRIAVVPLIRRCPLRIKVLRALRIKALRTLRIGILWWHGS